MPKKLSDGQIEALNEMLRRGTLTGDRAAAARELVRRHGKSERQRKLEEIERARNSGTGAFMTSFANAATLGLADRAVDLVNVGARALGLESMTREERRAMDEREAAENPLAAAAGTVAGAVAGGAGAGGVAARLGIRTARTLPRRAAQYAAAGGAAGAAEQVISEGEVSGNTLTAGAMGAVTGAAGGVVAEKVLQAIAPTVSRAWRKLAAKLQTPVEDMAAFIEDTRRVTGQMPSVAQAIHARDQGLLRGWAERHNTFGTAMDEAARAAPARDLSGGRLRRMRDDQMDAAIEPIRDRPVRLGEEFFESPHVMDALAGPKMKDIRIKIADGEPLTVGDVDRIRQKLRGMQKSEPGGPFGDFADWLRDEVSSQVPEYGEALERYSRQSKFTEGFEEAMRGRSLPEVEDTVKTPAGRLGHRAGELTRRGQEALRRIAPRVPPSAGDLNEGLEGLGRGAAHIAVGGRALGAFHVVRGLLDMLPESYQREIAEGLVSRDPRRIQQTLAQIRQAGVDLEDIRRLSGGLSFILGAMSSDAAVQSSGTVAGSQ